jgi:hypothetical protein
MSNIIRPTFGPKSPFDDGGADWQFFRSNPERQYHVRPATVDDLSLPDEPLQQPDRDDITIVEKVLDRDPGDYCDFSLRLLTRSVQGNVLDTDEDIGKLLHQLRWTPEMQAALRAEPWPVVEKSACSFCLKSGVYLVRSNEGAPKAFICVDCAVNAIRVIRDTQDLVPPGTPLSDVGEMDGGQ